MAKQFLHYWKPSTADAEADTKILDHAASNQFKRVAKGDTVWLVTARDGVLELIGKLKVAIVCGQAEAASHLRLDPDDLWDASHHIIAEDGGLAPVWAEIQKAAAKLSFVSSTGRASLDLDDGKVNPSQLQTMRELSAESAELLEQIFKDSYREPVAEEDDEGVDSDVEDEEEEEEEQEPGEQCPFCKSWNNWGEMDTCKHHIGVVFDGGMVESDIGQELESVWSSLADKIDVMEEMGEAELIKKSGADPEIVHLVLKKCSPNLVGFPELESIFNIQQGDLIVQDEGMLGSDVYSLFVEDSGKLDKKVQHLKMIDAVVPDELP